MESDKWSQLHDIALLYVCCMHGTDADIDKSELDVVRKLLNERNGDPFKVKSVLDDVMLMYVSRSGAEMLTASIAALRESVTDDGRLQLLQDLATIASADGIVYPNEVQFIVGVARQWGQEDFMSGGKLN